MFEFLSLKSDDDYINNILHESNPDKVTDEEFIVLEIQRFKASKRRKEMIDGEKYHEGNHDILKEKEPLLVKMEL